MDLEALPNLIILGIVLFGLSRFAKKVNGNPVVKGAVKNGAVNILKRVLK